MSLVKLTNGNCGTRGAATAPLAGTLDQWLGDLFAPAWREAAPGVRGAQRGFYPAIDISKGEQEVILRAELPGVRKEDVELTIHDETLTIKGTKKSEKEEKTEAAHYTERSYGEFTRTFTLPKTLDAEKVRAEFKDGVLELRFPVTEAARPRKIDISVN